MDDNKNLKKIEKLELLTADAEQEENIELFYDFDKAIEEKSKKPLPIKFQNKTWFVPCEMPFDFSMFFFRNCIVRHNGVDTFDVPENKVFDFIALMFGNEFMETLEKTRISTTLIFETIAIEILNKWGYGVKVKAKKEKIQKKI